MKMSDYNIKVGTILESKFRANWFLVVKEISKDGRFAHCQRIVDGHLCPNHTTLYVSNVKSAWKVIKTGIQLTIDFQRSRYNER